jgi:transposase
MKNLGLKLRKTAPIPGKCDPQLQFDFYTREMLPRLEEARLWKRKVLFVDAAHFVLGAFLGLVWCFQRVFLKTSPGRQRYNILGAIDSHQQEFTSIRTTDNITALTIVNLLDVIKEKYPNIPISWVMDNARYQHCAAVKAHAAKLDIELLFLPSYSPNLNLIERVWKPTKKKCLTNQYHKDFTSFRAAIDRCLDSFEDRLKPELESLLALNFQFFPNHKS